jgi:hypothetical protein
VGGPVWELEEPVEFVGCGSGGNDGFSERE